MVVEVVMVSTGRIGYKYPVEQSMYKCVCVYRHIRAREGDNRLLLYWALLMMVVVVEVECVRTMDGGPLHM